MNLRDQLREILPEILPEKPSDSIKGTELIRLVKYRLRNDYSDATLRYHFSIMCCDPTSPIAKVDQGQGYYLRPALTSLESARNLIRMSQGRLIEDDPKKVDRALLRAAKFRVIFSRFQENNSLFPFLFDPGQGNAVDGSDAHAGGGLWRVPDATLVEWELGDEGSGGGLQLDRSMMQLRQQLGSQPFGLTSVRLKVRPNYQTLREDFFQTVSAGEWAHRSELVYAASIEDGGLIDELRDLGNRFGVGVSSFGLDLDALDEWQDPTGIAAMGAREFEGLQTGINYQCLTPAPSRPTLNWAALSSLRQDNPGFEDLFAWLAACLDSGEAMTYPQFTDQKKRAS